MSLFGFARKQVDLTEIINKDHLLLDVRTVEEFESGNVAGSLNVPLHLLQEHLDEIKMMDKPVVAFCRSGMRSGQARALLSDAGVECYNGGSWNDVARMIIK